MDVATDGWCISVLKPGNVGYASTCQSVGLTTGFCVGYIIFTALESKGIITIAQFLIFWGVIFLIATTAIAIIKKEGDDKQKQEESLVEEKGVEQHRKMEGSLGGGPNPN